MSKREATIAFLTRWCFKMPPMSLAAMMPLQGPLYQVVSVLTNHPSLVCEALLCIFSSPLDRMNTLENLTKESFACTYWCNGFSRENPFSGLKFPREEWSACRKLSMPHTFQNIHRDILNKLLPPSPVHGFGGPFLYFKFAQTSCKIHHCHCYDLWFPL